ncbi:hypothetical protein B9Z65_8303 [Elsinoe australis]|uniref:Cytochrome P450 n=1 Tax=Elsinoe australis TaxID=40998 RepID=A0A2P7YDF7_9PEZI|nr:hypothetical protein B9Z65_8303 [Elsinoe australis]
MFSFLLLALVAILIVLVRTLLAFHRNIKLARQTKLPYTLSLVTELENWAYLTGPIVRKLSDSHLLKNGKGWPRWGRFMVKDWMYEDKYRAHQEFGDTFLVVSPGGMICYTADPDTAFSICQRRRDFIKPREKMKMIEPFGPSVVTTEGDLWRFHFRITAPPFKDEANRIVWAESQRQVEAMKQSWLGHGINNLKSDVYSLGVNVIAAAGFGRPQAWTADKAPPKGHRMTLVDSLTVVVSYLPHILLLPKWALKLFVQEAYTAHTEFDSFTREIIAEEKVRMSEGKALSSNVNGNLLSAMLTTGEREQKSSSERVALNDDEILGNIFMFYMAANDTTANTIVYSCLAMALYEESQDLVLQEIDRVMKSSASLGHDMLSHEEDFIKFRCMMAFLYETLRIFPVVLPVSRVTSGPQKLFGENTETLPDGCGTIVNITGVHYNEKCWPESHTFEPKRWLASAPNDYVPSKDDVDVERSQATIPGHVRGTFLAFSEGPRACLGRRFAQAEYVAFFSGVLKDHKLRLAPGVDRQEVETLLRRCSAGSPVSLMPPADVKLQLVKR